MLILITAAIAAAQPATASPTMPSDARAQHQKMEHMGHMSKEMADCHKRCEEMMAKMHGYHQSHSGHSGK